MQLNLYRELLERFYNYKVTAMYIVRLHPNDTSYEVVEMDMMRNEASEMLEQRRLVSEEQALVDSFGGLAIESIF